MRVRSVRRRRRSVTVLGTIVTDMDTFGHLRAADHARLCTVASGSNCGSDASHQPTNRLLMPLSDDGERHEQERAIWRCLSLDQFGPSGIRRPDFTMEEIGDDIVLSCF